jgi:L-alanine-DL-glutamate epimerase-like enolase superfamily enzyme
MKITRMEILPLTAPYLRADTPADHPANGVRNCVFVRLTADDGRTGWGEPYWGCYATEVVIASLKRLERSLLNGPTDDPFQTMRRVRFQNLYWAMRGIGASATSAIESAVYDLHAQSQGKPLWRILGDGVARPVLAYASAGDNSFSPDEIAKQVRRLRGLGFRAYKIRAGGRLTDAPTDRMPLDVQRVAAAREALGPDGKLFVDVGVPQRPQTWAMERAEAYIRALAPYDVGFFEEPALTYDVDGYAALQRLGLIPIAGGESFTDPAEFAPFFQAGAFGVAQPDAAVVGGPVSCTQVCRQAAACGVPVCLHAWSAGVGIAQNLHAAWAAPNAMAIEWPVSEHAPQTESLARLVRFEDGWLIPSDAPGLGVNVSDELLRKHPYQPDRERDF